MLEDCRYDTGATCILTDSNESDSRRLDQRNKHVFPLEFRIVHGPYNGKANLCSMIDILANGVNGSFVGSVPFSIVGEI